jgi:hypothetical protein
MQQDIYADGIGEITVTGTIVRIDFVSLSATERDANNNPKSIFRQRVVMPVDSFANAAELMQKVLAGLVEAGAVRRNGPLPADPLPEPAPTARAEHRPNGSPNFG